MPSKKEKAFNEDCRAVIGRVAGHGRLEKTSLSRQERCFILKNHETSYGLEHLAVKMNVIDHPFGSGRGKNPKSKIARETRLLEQELAY